MMRLCCFLLIAFFSLQASAQVVNIESERMQSDTVGWMGNFGTSFTLIQNVQQIISVDATAHVQYKSSKNLYLLVADYNLLKAEQQDLANNVFYHLRYNHKLTPRLRWEVFTQLQQNAVTGIKVRVLGGTGPRYKIADSKRFHLYIATAAMYEYEQEESDKPHLFHRDWRSSSYITFTYLPTETIEVVSTSFFQPLYRQLSDHRFLNQTSVAVKLSKHFSINTAFNYLYDAFPAAGRPRINYTFTNGIGYCF